MFAKKNTFYDLILRLLDLIFDITIKIGGLNSSKIDRKTVFILRKMKRTNEKFTDVRPINYDKWLVKMFDL